MKKITRFVSILAILLFAASCQNSDIDGGQTIDNGKLNLTATIVAPDATRVTYDVDNASTHTITPSWTVGDEIIGWDDQGETFTFSVAAVDGSGRATLDAGSYVPGAATKLYAIYSPDNVEGDIAGGKLTVNLGTQSGVLDDDSPVLMCATAEITAGSASLSFENQTAIIGVTKFKLPAAATVTSISVDGLITSGTFEVDGGGNLVLTPATAPATATATGSWATGAGNICETAIYFATLPTAGAKIALRASDGANDYGNLASIAATDIVAGNYYYMQKNLGAPVADVNGVKYGAIEDAFNAANLATVNVTLTLLADCSTTTRFDIDDAGSGAVTIDMNGHNLTTSKQIRATGRTLTILDSSSATLAEQGTITSTYAGGRAIYVEAGGTLYYQGCTITHSSSSYGTIYLTGDGTRGYLSAGKAISENYRAISVVTGAEAELSGSIVLWSTGHTIVATESAMIRISGGTFSRGGSSGYNVVRVGGAGAVVNITGGVFDNTESTSAGTLIYAGSDGGVINVSGGFFNSTGVNPVGSNGTTAANGVAYVTGGCFNKPIQETYAKSSTDVIYTNVLNPDAGTSDTYPFTVSDVSATPTVADVKQSTYSWNHGSIESAFKGADQRAKGYGPATLTLKADATASRTMAVNSGNTYNVVLDLNGHTISSTASPAISAAGKLVINDLGSSGELTTTGAVALSVSDGSTSFNSGSFYGTTNAVNVSGGTLDIYDGHFYGGGAADIVKTGGTLALSGGYYRYEPDDAWMADGYASAAASEVFKARSYDYQVKASSVVATVAGKNYGSWGAAVAAACSYNGSEDTIRIQLLESIITDAAVNLTHSTKPIKLDLNGRTIETSVSSLLNSNNSLTVIDSGSPKGMISSSESNVVNKIGTGTVSLIGILIKTTKTVASGTYGAQAVVRVNNSSSTLIITDCILYSTGMLTGVSNAAGTLTITDTEITSGSESDGLVGVFTGGSNANTTLTNCRVYTTSTTASRGIFYIGTSESAGTLSVNGGYYYGKIFGRGYTSSTQLPHLTISSGYFNVEPKSGTYYPTFATGTSVQNVDPAVTQLNSVTKKTLSYNYKVDTTP
ncbi:MAG: hypothetical protein IKR82_06590 [Bacteroidales bacterium]|nr:hypothetical protein [Bacteroidales bacterium]